ncbi:MAG: carboxymuconolactone decarboxylase family protein [Acidimicrobiaceae bacterium]|nr:carboxymuconolactone decarboxylase family protein [Acidimicrobiaceae bacterium]
MTWIDAPPSGDTDWERLASICPEAFDALAGLIGAAWQDVDPVLVELCRLRIATLLGNTAELARHSDRARAAGLTDAKIAALPSWPTSPGFSAAERSCLAVAEQFVIDANGVTEGQVAELCEHLGAAGCYAFVQAVSALETFQRACLTLGVQSAPPVDRLATMREGNR